jgi:hypothetical protein
MKKIYLILIFIIILTTPCKIENIQIIFKKEPSKNASNSRYTQTDLEQHFIEEEVNSFSNNLLTMFSCVDGRTTEKVFGTPGN